MPSQAAVRGPALPFLLLALTVSAAVGVQTAQSAPATNGFTYQGQLSTHGGSQSKAIKSADIRFTLYDSETGGNAIGSTLERSFGVLIGGRFVTTLDFGTGAFTGQARWLELQLRTPSGSGAYTTLTPRQQIMASPYALYALNGGEGPQGPAGPVGPVGAIGALGPVGPRGATGATGPAGPQGIQGLVGAQGIIGPQGAIGPVGPKGDKGDGGGEGVVGQ